MSEALVRLPAQGLFGGDVVRRSHHDAWGDRPERMRIHVLKQAEIADFHVAVLREKEVVRLEVAVQDRPAVGVEQPFQGLSEPAGAEVGGRRPGAFDPGRQVAVRQVLHRQPVQRLAVLGRQGPRGEDLHDVGAGEPAQHLGLSGRERQQVGVGGVAAGHLDGDVAVETELVGQVDRAHSAAGQLGAEGKIAPEQQARAQDHVPRRRPAGRRVVLVRRSVRGRRMGGPEVARGQAAEGLAEALRRAAARARRQDRRRRRRRGTRPRSRSARGGRSPSAGRYVESCTSCKSNPLAARAVVSTATAPVWSNPTAMTSWNCPPSGLISTAIRSSGVTRPSRRKWRAMSAGA